MAIAIRALSGALSILEILTTRAALGLAVLCAVMLVRPELRLGLRSRRLPLHIVRNTFHFGSQYLWAWALLLLPLATVFALEFTMPAWTILLAPVFLGERMTASRIGAIVLGIAGVLVIVRPGLETFQPAALMVLVAALGYAVCIIATKKLTTTESTFAIIFWMSVIQLALGAAGAGITFVSKLGLEQIPALIGVGAAGLTAHYCLTNAFRAGDASLVIPLDLMRIPLIAVVGWWLYSEALDVYVFAGAGLIISGILWNLRSETRRPTIAAKPALGQGTTVAERH
jgi:drug/metabolite transporter (DMT)-like permease